MTPGITPLIAGNWKMNGLTASLAELEAIATATAAQAGRDVLICLPHTLLGAAASRMGGRLALGGQDCHPAAAGAHTGDISAEMLADAGARFVLVGHSERRTDHGESDELVRAKAEAALRAGLHPIVCIGETLAEREAGHTLAILAGQLGGSLPASGAFTVAYEPVWAIGTGRVPSFAEIAQAHQFIRGRLEARGDGSAASRILYGGSVNPENARDILGVEHVDGALVGGASLKARNFLAICDSLPAS